jgi:hypothetical protein
MASKPFVMVLSLAGDNLFADTNTHLLQALRIRAHVTISLTASDALQHLHTSDLAAVLVTDCQINDSETPFEEEEVLTELIEYARSGRPVVIGGTFSAWMRFPDFAEFFGENWGVQWTFSTSTRNEFSYNPAANNLFKDEAKLPPSLPRMKGVQLTGFKPGDAVYLTKVDEDEDEDGPDEPNVSKTTREKPAESPIVYTRLGKGYLGYVGFSNGEKELTDVVLAMLRL